MPQRQLRFMFEDAAGPAARKRREDKEKKLQKKFTTTTNVDPLQVFIIHKYWKIKDNVPVLIILSLIHGAC